MMHRPNRFTLGLAVLCGAALLHGCASGPRGDRPHTHSQAQTPTSTPAQAPAQAHAQVQRPAGSIRHLDIRSRRDAFGGLAFGAHGSYEWITAVVHGSLDPHHPANAGIVDLKLAPRTADGQVSYQTDAIILRPKDASKARRVMLYDVANRGRPLSHQLYFNEGNGFATAANAGNGFLMRQGVTVVWSGWQGDTPMSAHTPAAGTAVGTAFPIAKQADGSAVTGTVRDEFIFDKREATRTAALSYAVSANAAQLSVLRARQTRNDPWITLSGWQITGERQVRFAHPPGLDAGAIFEFIYSARDPVVMGIGLAAIRDLNSFLRFNERDGSGQPNPLWDLRAAPCEQAARAPCPANPASTVDVAILTGISQSGRLVRDFIWQDFNRDGAGRQVFNGAMPFIAGSRKTWINERFAQPGRWSRQHEEHYQVGDQFPFTYGVSTDPVSGKTDGIFSRCSASRSCPKLMHLDGAAEFWQARASLIGTDGLGRDLPLPADVRAYLMSGTPHAYNPTGRSTKAESCALPSNVVNPGSTSRALFTALVDWVGKGTPPPDSRWPSVARGSLADPANRQAMGLPDLSAIGVHYRGVHNSLMLTDYSPVPPVANPQRRYTVLVPTADRDGNDLPGVRTPDLQAPLATHLPWNPRDVGFAPGQACGGQGATLPFASERAVSGDPRVPLKQRYANKGVFVGAATAAAQNLQAQRLMLAEDVQRWRAWAEALPAW